MSLKLGTLPNEREAKNESGAEGDGQRSDALADFGVEVAPARQAHRGGEGLYVIEVDPDGVAAQKGLRRGDVIVEAGGQTLAEPSDLTNALQTAKRDGRRSVLLRVKSPEGMRFVAIPIGR